jgi:hypothetical protein
MSTFLPARWLAALPALAAFAASAQAGPAPTGAAAAEPAAALSFRSAMEGYKPFADEKPIPWKEANETAHQRGGWRAYAKEGGGEADDKPSGAANPHAGHSKEKP